MQSFRVCLGFLALCSDSKGDLWVSRGCCRNCFYTFRIEKHVGNPNTAHTSIPSSSRIRGAQLSPRSHTTQPSPRSLVCWMCMFGGGQMLQQKLTSASCVLPRSQPFPQFLGTPPPFPLLSLPDVVGLGWPLAPGTHSLTFPCLFGKCERRGVGNCIDRQKEVAPPDLGWAQCEATDCWKVVHAVQVCKCLPPSFFLKFIFMCLGLVPTHVHNACPVFTEARRGLQIPWAWNFRQF